MVRLNKNLTDLEDLLGLDRSCRCYFSIHLFY